MGRLRPLLLGSLLGNPDRFAVTSTLVTVAFGASLESGFLQARFKAGIPKRERFSLAEKMQGKLVRERRIVREVGRRWSGPSVDATRRPA